MLSLRLIHLLDAHSERLADTLYDSLLKSPECSDLRKVPHDHLRVRAREIYRNLSDWLAGRTEEGIAKRYLLLGRERAEQGVRFSHFLWAIRVTKETLYEFLEHEGLSDNPVELHASLELLTLLDRFFDSAVYHAALGYQRYEAHRARTVGAA